MTLNYIYSLSSTVEIRSRQKVSIFYDGKRETQTSPVTILTLEMSWSTVQMDYEGS